MVLKIHLIFPTSRLFSSDPESASLAAFFSAWHNNDQGDDHCDRNDNNTPHTVSALSQDPILQKESDGYYYTVSEKEDVVKPKNAFSKKANGSSSRYHQPAPQSSHGGGGGGLGGRNLSFFPKKWLFDLKIWGCLFVVKDKKRWLFTSPKTSNSSVEISVVFT